MDLPELKILRGQREEKSQNEANLLDSFVLPPPGKLMAPQEPYIPSCECLYTHLHQQACASHHNHPENSESKSALYFKHLKALHFDLRFTFTYVNRQQFFTSKKKIIKQILLNFGCLKVFGCAFISHFHLC